MVNKFFGALSERIDEIIGELIVQPERWSTKEMVLAINEAFQREGFADGCRITAGAFASRLGRLHSKNRRVQPNKRITGNRSLPKVVIGISPDAVSDGMVWNAKLDDILRTYYEKSRELRPGAAEALLQEMYRELKSLAPSLNEHSIRTRATSCLRLGHWGMTAEALLAARLSDINAVFSVIKEPIPRKKLYELLLGRFAEKGDDLSAISIQKIIEKNGLTTPKLLIGRKETLSAEEGKYSNFARLWNDQHVATSDDLVRLVGTLWSEPDVQWKKIRDYAKRYVKYRLAKLEEDPEYELLKPLIVRKRLDGTFIPLPQEILDHLEDYSLDRSLLKKAKGVVVTAAQWGAPLHREYWATLKQYAEFMGYVLVVMPMKYGAIKVIKGQLRTFLSPELRGHMIWDDVLLAGGQLRLNVARFRPTLERYLTDSVCNMGGNTSQVFGGTRLELDHRSRIGHRYPKAIMTTGAVTRPNYKVDALGQQDRTGEVATENHEFAAIVFEFPESPKDEFHFRQLLADKNGEFYDVDVKHGGARRFAKNGQVPAFYDVEGVVLGDWHTNTTCPEVRRTTFGSKTSIVSVLQPSHVIVHDFMDNEAANSYRAKQGVRSAYLARFGRDSVEGELLENVEEIKWIRARVPVKTKLHWVPSNHPDLWLTQWVDSGSWTQDHLNRVIGARLFMMMYEDLEQRAKKDKLPQGKLRVLSPIRLYMGVMVPELHVIDRQETFILPKGKGGRKILLSLHGDLGPGGQPSRGTIPFLKYNHDVILGHNHTAIKYRGIWRVGTSTTLMKHYVEGPATSWTNTHAVIFRNGQVMLINIVNGRWHGQEVASNDNKKQRRKKKVA